MEAFGGRDALPLAIVDYAHTPDALAKALRAARRHCRGRLRAIFGCGGDRDPGKRPMMGRIAAELADELVVTDDNPRSEPPGRIVADVLAGIPGGVAARVEHDRASAIRTTLEGSGAEDVVLIAGKGHEEYQIYGSERRPFSDQSVARAALEAMRP
jgi:UDP-N-acetylmuramoyl-L-alanyl-D-glutamate--2,6-diaminopimelate ligase